MKRTKNQTIILLCFTISLTERFTQASIPLIVNYLGLTGFEMSLFLSAMSASTVFVGLVVAPFIDSYDQKRFLCLIFLTASIALVSFSIFTYSHILTWGCLLTFSIGTVLRIINFRRLIVINREIDKCALSQAHTRMQLSITIAMALAPVFLALTAADSYLKLAITLVLVCVILSACTSSVPHHPLPPTPVVRKRVEPKILSSANHFIFTGMLLSGLFISILLTYCQSISDSPTQLYSYIIFSQVIGLIVANIMFERFFSDRFNRYHLLIILIAIAELCFIYTTSSILISLLAFLIGFSFQIMFLRSHNQFQHLIPRGLTAKLNGIRGMYTFAGVTIGYFAGPLLYQFGGLHLVFLSCSAVALVFFLFLDHLKPCQTLEGIRQ